MSVEQTLQDRSESKCELCAGTEALGVYEVPASPSAGADASAFVCEACREGIEGEGGLDVHHWRCLGESMWSEVAAVQVVAWRLLKRLSDEGWARELLDTLYLEEGTQSWAEAGADEDDGDEAALKHVDSNGGVLAAGDTVVLIKDLNVKGGGFTAKRGTAVRNISLVANNAGHIEGRISGQLIVILTEFVKKQG